VKRALSSKEEANGVFKKMALRIYGLNEKEITGG
jgi:hypothetical protein